MKEEIKELSKITSALLAVAERGRDDQGRFRAADMAGNVAGNVEERARRKVLGEDGEGGLAGKKKKLQAELKEYERFRNGMTRIDDKYQKFREKVDSEIANFGVATVSAALQSVAGKHKAFAAAAKGVMIGEAVANTYVAATKALASGYPPFNFIAMASVVAAGLAQVAKIKEQKFQQGGPVRGPSHAGGGVFAELEGGENVWSRRDVSAFGGQVGVEMLKRGGAGSFSPTVVINLSGSATRADAEMVSSATVARLESLRRLETDRDNATLFRVQAVN